MPLSDLNSLERQYFRNRFSALKHDLDSAIITLGEINEEIGVLDNDDLEEFSNHLDSARYIIDGAIEELPNV